MMQKSIGFDICFVLLASVCICEFCTIINTYIIFYKKFFFPLNASEWSFDTYFASQVREERDICLF